MLKGRRGGVANLECEPKVFQVHSIIIQTVEKVVLRSQKLKE